LGSADQRISAGGRGPCVLVSSGRRGLRSSLGGDYKGHSDIIVAVESARIWIIGGNVGDSVTKRPLPLDARGFLVPTSQGGETVFAIMQDRISSPQSNSPDVGGAATGTKVSQPAANEVAGATLQGFDADFDCSQHLGKAKAVGINFIGRYYSNSPGKNLSPSEARLITGAGMFIVAVWETLGDRASFFSLKQGADDATSASNQAQTIGQPIDSAIYFALDYDASPEEIAGGITDYFKGVQKGLAAAMRQVDLFRWRVRIRLDLRHTL
jgi:hypothetical protein